MSEWISLTERPPENGQKVRIKTYDKNGENIEIDAIFTLYDIDEWTEAWGWNIGQRDDTIARPTHWMPLPLPPCSELAQR